MITSGLLLTLEPGHLDDVSSVLRRDPRVEIGDPVSNRLPLVLHTEDEREGEAVTAALRERAGVAWVDVVCVYFEPGEASS